MEKTLASDSDNIVHLWDVMTGEQKRTLTGHTEGVQSLAFSPDGGTIASGGWDKTIRLWEVATGKHKEILLQHTWTIWSLKFSPDGRHAGK